jgi:hypothetical protein
MDLENQSFGDWKKNENFKGGTVVFPIFSPHPGLALFQCTKAFSPWRGKWMDWTHPSFCSTLVESSIVK